MQQKVDTNLNIQKLTVYILLTVITFAVFWQLNRYDFISFDDGVYVSDNSYVRSGITMQGLRWAFTTTYAEFWHPLTWLSLMLDHHLYGSSAGGYHLTNIILHILSTLLLFRFLHQTTGHVWRSAFAAALFALHPLRVESVAWIAERKDVLSAFFWMLTLCLYVYYTKKPDIKRYILVVFSFACGLMSKSMVVTLPVILILLDYWPLKRFNLQKDNLLLWQMKEKVLFFIMSATFSIITVYAQEGKSVVHPLTSRIANAPITFVSYLAKIFWPSNLALIYPYSEHTPIWQILGATFFIIAVSIMVIIFFKRFPYLFVGWLWYAVGALPVIGIMTIGDPMSDRYVYLPSAGIGIMLAWGLPNLLPGKDLRKMILCPAAVIFLAFLAFVTWKQCAYWKSNTILLSHTLQVTKDNYLAHNVIATSLLKENNFMEAVYHCEESIRLKPDFARAYYKRASIYAKLGKYESAISDYSEAIRLQPDDSASYSNRALIYLKQRNNDLGCKDAQRACELKNCRILEIARARKYCN